MKTLYRRKKEGKTDYKLRLRLLSSNKTRLVVRRSLKNISAQLINYEPNGDKTIVSANTRELVKLGWKSARRNTPSAYLIGLLIADKAKKKHIAGAILDIGLLESIKNSLPFAVLKGAIDGGLKIAHSPDNLPDEKRLTGGNIKNFDVETFNKIKSKFKA